ncbi:hypothetical protein, partial [Pantoea sp. ANP04]|uniref:hypothetical protein n=1 Tax=Pantoea sp. ANP04 TaxID=3064896 RepID=UPI0035C5EB4C
MSSYFTRTERISIQRGKLVRIITAHGIGKKFKDKNLDVCKIYEDGRTFIRNIDYKSLAGWMINWPEEMIDNGYGYKYKAELEKWVKVNHDMNSLSCAYPSESDKEKVISVYPDF